MPTFFIYLNIIVAVAKANNCASIAGKTARRCGVQCFCQITPLEAHHAVVFYLSLDVNIKDVSASAQKCVEHRAIAGLLWVNTAQPLLMMNQLLCECRFGCCNTAIHGLTQERGWFILGNKKAEQ